MFSLIDFIDKENTVSGTLLFNYSSKLCVVPSTPSWFNLFAMRVQNVFILFSALVTTRHHFHFFFSYYFIFIHFLRTCTTRIVSSRLVSCPSRLRLAFVSVPICVVFLVWRSQTKRYSFQRYHVVQPHKLFTVLFNIRCKERRAH